MGIQNSIHSLITGANAAAYLNKAEAGLNKASSWLGKGITGISKSFRQVGAQLPTAEKTATTAADIFKSPYFQGGGLIALGVVAMITFGNELWCSRTMEFSYDHHVVYAIGFIAGIALTAVGIALATGQL
jgi:hypothetical protein